MRAVVHPATAAGRQEPAERSERVSAERRKKAAHTFIAGERRAGVVGGVGGGPETRGLRPRHVGVEEEGDKTTERTSLVGPKTGRGRGGAVYGFCKTAVLKLWVSKCFVGNVFGVV